jgi:hypothetical protein
LETAEANRAETAVNLESPAARVVEPERTSVVRPTDAPVVRANAAATSEISRAESTIAETQMVSRSNALAESVHELELPANSAPELQAAKVRLQERSLLISQSADKAKLLDLMQADLKVLEKSVTPEALGKIRQSIAELQSPASTLERSGARVGEDQGALVRPLEGHAPVDNSAGLPRGSMEQTAQVRQAESVESQTAKATKSAQSLTQSTNPAVIQAPHAVSVQEQSLKLLENGELPRAGREAVSKIIQDTNNWGAKSLAQRSEAVARLDENLKVLSADAATAKDLATLTNSVESLRLGTKVEAAAVKADAELGNLTSRLSPQVAENAEFQAAHARLKENTQSIGAAGNKASTAGDLRADLEKMERIAGPEAMTPVRQSVMELEKAAAERDVASSFVAERTVPPSSSLSEVHAAPRHLSSNGLRSEAAAEEKTISSASTASREAGLLPVDTRGSGIASRQELETSVEQLRGHSATLQNQTLGVIERGGLNSQSRKALVNVVQDSGNVGRLEGAERANMLHRIEQNLKIASEDKGIAADARTLSNTFDSLETSSLKAQRLEQLDKVSSETLPRIADETAALRKPNLAHTASSVDRVGAHLDAIDRDAASLTSIADKTGALSGMQANVDRLEGLLGKESVAPLRENVDRLEHAYRNSARASKLEETAAASFNSRESLNREMRALSGSEAQLSTASRAAAEDIQGLTSTNQRFNQADISRLREGVAAVSNDVEPAVSARLNSHLHNVETNYQLGRLDRALSNVSEDTATVNRQTALAASRNSAPVVAALHHATESLRLNGVAELSAVRVAFEKALPALGREDAININRSLSRIENQTVEVHSLKHQIAEVQKAHIAVAERNPHWYSQNEVLRAREVHQIVVSPRDRAVEEVLKRAETSRNTSELAVFKPAVHAVSDVPVSGLSSRISRWREINETAQNIAARVGETVFGLQRHPVAASLSIGMGAFMLESGRAMAQSPTDNLRQANASQIDFSPRTQVVPASTDVISPRANASAVADTGVQAPLVRGILSAEYASLSPTIQALLRTPDGGFDPSNGQRMKFGNSLLWAAAQSGVPEEVVAKAVVYARVVKASSISVGQPESTDKDRSRIFYPPFKSPMASVSSRVRKPQNLLGAERPSLANSTSFLTSKLAPNTNSLTNPLNFTRERADGGSEEQANGGSIKTGANLDLASNASSTSTALLNAAVPDPSVQAVSQPMTSES